MASVKVVVTNEQTGLTRQTVSGANGEYVIPLLPVGVYVVTGELTGFKTAIHSAVALTVDQIQRVDMLLAPGNVSESVEVRRTRSSSTPAAPRWATRLPRGRSPSCRSTAATSPAAFLGAGAVETERRTGRHAARGGNAISIMGARPTSNNFMIDGTANIDTSIGTPAAVLSVDAIQEFKEQTTTYSADTGSAPTRSTLVSKTARTRCTGPASDSSGTMGGTRETSSTTSLGLRRSWISSSGWSPAAGDAARMMAEPHVLPGQLRGTRIDRRDRPSTRCRRRGADGQFDSAIIDPQTGTPFPNNAVPQARFSRLTQLALRNGWFPAPNTSAAQGTTSPCERFHRSRTSSRIRGRPGSRQFGRVFVRYTNTTYENTTPNLIEAGDQVFVQDTQNWQVSHSWPVRNTDRQPVPDWPCRCARRPEGIACPAE